MIDPRWARAKDLLFLALEVPVDQRLAWLQEACSDDPSLVSEVELLLRNHLPSDDFRDAIEEGVRWVLELPWRTGTQVGPYQVQDRIGLGATGEVYQAVRNDIQQRVALKFLHVAGIRKEGEAASHREAAFQREATVLAQLNHPNVAQLHGIETANDGSPVLVMEYVDGRPFDAFLRSSSLPLRDQLGLFRTVCLAVDAVHAQGIVHGDIKPSNILITQDGLPKVLDFGVARRLQVPTDKLFGLTPSYASPEQLAGNDPTERSDVYSLGVLLFEVLTSDLPYQVTGHTRKEAAEIVSSTNAPPPSRVLARLVVPSEGPGGGGSPLLPWTSRSVRGDLDAIVLKALSKDPNQRYGSAGELAEDIARLLSFRPVRALPWSPLYVGRRFARRHRAVVAITTASLAVVLGGSLWVGMLRETLALAGARSSARDGAALYQKGLYADSLAACEAGLAKIAPESVSPGKSARDSLDLLLGAGRAHLALVAKAANPAQEADRAVQRFESAIALAASDRSGPLYGEAEQGLGEAHLAKARVDGRGPTLQLAAEAFQRAAASQKSARPKDYAASLAGLAETHLRLAEVRDSPVNLKLALEESSEAAGLLGPEADRHNYLRARLTAVVIQTALTAQGADPVAHAREAIKAIDGVLALARPDVDTRILIQGYSAKAGLNTRLAAVTQQETDFQNAEKDFLACLEFLNPKAQPLDHAKVTGNLGLLYLNWADWALGHNHPDDRLAFLRKARSHMEQALRAHSFEESPLAWGRYHYNLALTLGQLGDATNDAQLLQEAVNHGEAARRVFRASDYPEQNAANCFATGRAQFLLGALKKDQALVRAGLDTLQQPIAYLESTNNRQRLGLLYGSLGLGWRRLWQLSRDPHDAAAGLAAYDRSVGLLAVQASLADGYKRDRAEFLDELEGRHR